jgi:hypothetical protein
MPLAGLVIVAREMPLDQMADSDGIPVRRHLTSDI